ANPLVELLVPAGAEGERRGAGGALREEVLGAVESLKPADHVDAGSRPWLLYRILQSRYVEARDPTAVQIELAMSKSQYYREHEAALGAITAVLRQELNKRQLEHTGRAAAATGDQHEMPVGTAAHQPAPGRSPQANALIM